MISLPSQLTPTPHVTERATDKEETRSYRRLPRWRRCMHCVPVLIRALPLTVYVRRSLGKTPLPDLLHALTPDASASMLSVDPCRTVVERLVVRKRKNRCLPRALVLYALLAAGRPERVRFRLGVQRPQTGRRFAHAWVELDGVPLGEADSIRQTHRTLFAYPELGPRTSHSQDVRPAP